MLSAVVKHQKLWVMEQEKRGGELASGRERRERSVVPRGRCLGGSRFACDGGVEGLGC